MKHLSADWLSEITEQLRRDEAENRKTLLNLSKEDPFNDPDHGGDNAANDTDAFEQNAHQRIESIQLELLQNIERITHSLEQIQNGLYGICENCGKDIDEGRLRIMPTATLCISCERKLEK